MASTDLRGGHLEDSRQEALITADETFLCDDTSHSCAQRGIQVGADVMG